MSGTCGDLKNDGGSSFFNLACGGLYFGGAAVGVPLPSIIPDMGSSITKATCSGTTLTLSNTTSTDTGSNRNCTSLGCLFGPPLPIPNGSHAGSATSTCVINTVSANAAGTANCSTGTTTALNLPLSSGLFLDGDLMPMRCSGGSTPGANCTGSGGCGTVAPSSCPGGTCVNDTGRCASGGGQTANTACCSDADCTGSGSCETGVCVGGSNANFGCITDADCPGGGSCRTFIQPCPICNATTLKCNGGANDGGTCATGDSGVNGDYPTSHDCPPPAANNLGTLPIGFVLDTGTVSKTAFDNLPDQSNVFCGFCRNKTLNSFARRCGGTPAGSVCTGTTGSTASPCSAAAPCLPIPCTSNSDCSGQTQSPGFTSCGQQTSGAFTSLDVARTITETGSPATGASTGGPAVASKLVSIFCIPLTFNSLVDSAANLPGPGATALTGTTQLLP